MYTYKEMGCIWQIELLSREKDSDGETFNLKVHKVVVQNKHLVEPSPGHEFSVWRADGTMKSYAGWTLEQEENGKII